MAYIDQEYEKLQLLGQGSFATIWKVRHRKLEYVRALKVSKEVIADENDHAYQVFLKECKVLLRLGNGCHPNIVRIYQPRLLDGRASVEMDYVKGVTLNDYLQKHKFMEMSEFYRLFEEIVGALAYCHHDIYEFLMDPNVDDLKNDPNDGQKYIIDPDTERKLVKKYSVTHNDLHSNNIMRRDYDGGFVLLDFGLAIQDGKAVKSSSRRGGALEYMAPEKFDDNGVITTQSDVYSLGILLYEALAGRVPFVLDDADSFSGQMRLFNLHKTGIPPAIEPLRSEAFAKTHPGQTYVKDYPDWLVAMILKCLAKNPEDRYTDAKELLVEYRSLYHPIEKSATPQVKIIERKVEVPVEKIVEKVVEVPVDGTLTPFLKLKSDLDCTFYLDGEKRAEIKAGEIKKIPLPKGEYELKFVTMDGKDIVEDVHFVMPDSDKQYLIELLHEQEIRKKKEELASIERENKKKMENGQFDVNGVSFKMVRVQGGTFWMGADNGDKGLFKKIDNTVQNFYGLASDFEKPVHEVTLSDYFIAETVVTQELWQAVMGSNPSYYRGKNKPVEHVSWDDCELFIQRLNSITGKNFRLPTESEWEFAARGGNESRGYIYAGSNIIDEVGWYSGNTDTTTHDVKTKLPNELDLFDMSGNVWEWCNDWYGSYSSNSQTNPKGPSTGSSRVLRGGSWNFQAWKCRVSSRDNDYPAHKGSVGFRLALDAE